MKVIMKMNEEVKKLLESSATIVNNKYYYLPYWFENNNKGEYILHRFDNLPPELKQELEGMRTKKTLLEELGDIRKQLIEASLPPVNLSPDK